MVCGGNTASEDGVEPGGEARSNPEPGRWRRAETGQKEKSVQEKQISQARAAYRLIEERIVTLDLRPGGVVTEKHLIEMSGFGRTPVREALQRLSWEGLIEIRPRSGVLVTDIRPEDYLRVMQPRLALEPMLARSVARFADGFHRERLADCALAMRRAAREADVEGFLKADKACDEILEDACPNPYLARALAPLQSHSRRFWFRFGARGGPQESARGHLAVMEAIMSEDEAGAEAAMMQLMAGLQQIAASYLP